MDFGDFYRGKRVLVTGHTGFKGAWLALWLKSLGADCIGLALPVPATEPGIFRAAHVAEGLTHIEGDIRDAGLVAEVIAHHQPQIVFHLAAQALVRQSYRSPIETYATNVVGTAHVLEAARSCESIRSIVVVTTDKCYENHEQHGGYREEDRLGGYDPYSSSKACAELVTAAYRDSYFKARDVGVATARAGNVIGGGDWAADRLVPDFVRAIQHDEPIRLRRPNAVRPWQFVLEPLSGYLLLAARMWNDPVAFAGGWNFGPEAAAHTTVLELAERLVAAFGCGEIVIEENDALHETGYLALNCLKAHERLDWQPVLNVEDTIAWTAEWYCTLLRHPASVADLTQQQVCLYKRLHGRADRGLGKVA